MLSASVHHVNSLISGFSFIAFSAASALATYYLYRTKVSRAAMGHNLVPYLVC